MFLNNLIFFILKKNFKVQNSQNYQKLYLSKNVYFECSMDERMHTLWFYLSRFLPALGTMGVNKIL